MPDISLCEGRGCERKDRCYRHTAQPSPWRQSWFSVPPIKADGTCEYFWPNAERGPHGTGETP